MGNCVVKLLYALAQPAWNSESSTLSPFVSEQCCRKRKNYLKKKCDKKLLNGTFIWAHLGSNKRKWFSSPLLRYIVSCACITDYRTEYQKSNVFNARAFTKAGCFHNVISLHLNTLLKPQVRHLLRTCSFLTIVEIRISK